MALKARKTYKEHVAKVTEAMQKAKEQQENKSIQPILDAQRAELGAFLLREAEKPSPFPFLMDMKRKLDEGEILSDNMLNAVRKCIKREQERQTKDTASEEQEERTITLKLRAFLMQEMGIDSRIISGTIKRESAKAWLIEGHADMVANISFCVRCGRELKEPASQITGMGRTCAEKLGITYDTQMVLDASPAKRKAIKKAFQKKLHAQKFERWIPKSQVEVMQ